MSTNGSKVNEFLMHLRKCHTGKAAVQMASKWMEQNSNEYEMLTEVWKSSLYNEIDLDKKVSMLYVMHDFMCRWKKLRKAGGGGMVNVMLVEGFAAILKEVMGHVYSCCKHDEVYVKKLEKLSNSWCTENFWSEEKNEEVRRILGLGVFDHNKVSQLTTPNEAECSQLNFQETLKTTKTLLKDRVLPSRLDLFYAFEKQVQQGWLHFKVLRNQIDNWAQPIFQIPDLTSSGESITMVELQFDRQYRIIVEVQLQSEKLLRAHVFYLDLMMVCQSKGQEFINSKELKRQQRKHNEKIEILKEAMKRWTTLRRQGDKTREEIVALNKHNMRKNSKIVDSSSTAISTPNIPVIMPLVSHEGSEDGDSPSLKIKSFDQFPVFPISSQSPSAFDHYHHHQSYQPNMKNRQKSSISPTSPSVDHHHHHRYHYRHHSSSTGHYYHHYSKDDNGTESSSFRSNKSYPVSEHSDSTINTLSISRKRRDVYGNGYPSGNGGNGIGSRRDQSRHHHHHYHSTIITDNFGNSPPFSPTAPSSTTKDDKYHHHYHNDNDRDHDRISSPPPHSNTTKSSSSYYNFNNKQKYSPSISSSLYKRSISLSNINDNKSLDASSSLTSHNQDLHLHPLPKKSKPSPSSPLKLLPVELEDDTIPMPDEEMP